MRKTVNTETEGVFDGRSCGSQTPPLRGEIMKKAVANSRAEAGNFLALTRKLQTFHYAFRFLNPDISWLWSFWEVDGIKPRVL